MQQLFELEPASYVRIKSHVWPKGKKGLYDYENCEVLDFTLRARQDSTLCFSDNRLELKAVDELAQCEDTKVIQLTKDNNKYFVESTIKGKDVNGQLWLIVRSLRIRTPRIKLVMSQSDVIRLGQIMLKVVLKANTPWIYNAAFTSAISHSNSQDGSCRVCYESNNEVSDPLLSICSCKGSMQYIHVNCLKSWISIGIAKRDSDNVTSYCCRNFACEICKTIYPLVVVAGENRYFLLDDLNTDDKNLILFNLTKDNDFERNIYIIRPTEAKTIFVLGRSHEADVRLDDGFVSRVHAQITYTTNGYVLDDKNSKFGTLILLRGKQELSRKNDLSVQVGSNIITLGIKEKQAEPKGMEMTEDLQSPNKEVKADSADL